MNRVCKVLLVLTIFITLSDGLKCYFCTDKPKAATTDARKKTPGLCNSLKPLTLGAKDCSCHEDEQGDLLDCPKEENICYIGISEKTSKLNISQIGT